MTARWHMEKLNVYVVRVWEIHFLFLQERDLGDEYGWKQVHGDVFRTPSLPIVFTSLIGTGYQLAVVSLGCIVVALVGDLYTQ